MVFKNCSLITKKDIFQIDYTARITLKTKPDQDHTHTHTHTHRQTRKVQTHINTSIKNNKDHTTE